MSITTLHPEWRQAAKDIAEGFKYGDIITLDWLASSFHLIEPESIAQFKEYQFAFLSNMDAMRQELLEQHQLALRNVRGAGYELVDPNNQVDYAWQTAFARVNRELRKLASHVTHIRHAELSDEKRREHADAQAKMSSVAGFVTRAARRGLAAPMAQETTR
ncbi:hypothetical protein [Pseudomonas sp. UBA6323]|uniref:hypothetical protein n=1 Tax=Pseudomonas sp. UBA6323 TaxID=1947329 RepID=UPI0025CD65D5|nr:hypothetical protein [Pseudomonas sp. UBA6323]